MRNKKQTWIALFIIVCMVLLSGCSGNSKPKVKDKEEGESIQVKVSYSPCNEGIRKYFLSEGDKIAVISPSSLPERKMVDDTIKGLAALGYRTVEGKYVSSDVRTLEQCKNDLEWALTDPEIKAIFCVRGGYAATEVMDEIPLDMIKNADKLIIGYSDITVYHSAWTTVGVPSIHASMGAAFDKFAPECFETEIRIMQGEMPSYTCDTTEFCRKGFAEGTLIGGNLATFTAVLNTEYDSSALKEPYILFLEEVGEDYQHIHRFLTILKHSGILDRAEGIILGEWVDLPEDMGDYDGNSRGGSFKSVDEMIYREFFSDSKIPVAYGFPAGHGDLNYPLMMGTKVRMNVKDYEYTVECDPK